LFVLWLFMQDNPDSLSAQALDLAAVGRISEAESLWRKAAQLSPTHFPSLFNLGFTAFRQGQDQQSIQWLDRASKAIHKDFNTLYLLGSAHARLNQTNQALTAWRSALLLQPTNRKLMQVMSVEYSKGSYFNEAAQVSEAALRLAPDDLSLYFLLLKALQDSGEHDQAFALARRTVNKFPKSARAHFEVGFHLHKTGRSAEALPFFDAAIALDPIYEEPHYFRGDVLLRQDKPQEAESSFRQALKLRTNYTLASLGLARTLTAQDKLTAAVDSLKEATRQDPANPQPYLVLSQIFFRLGNLEESKDAKQTSQRLRRSSPELVNMPQPRSFPKD